MEPTPAALPTGDKVLSASFIKLWFALMFFMLNMSTFNLLPYYLELRGASPDFYGSVAGSMGVSNFASLILLGWRADHWSRKATVGTYFMASLGGNLVALWAMGQPDLNWYYVSRLLHGVFMGLGFPQIYSWTVELSPQSKRHVVLAWLGVGGILANSLGPTLGELVLSLQPRPDHPDAYLPVFAVSTGFQLVSLAFFLVTPNSRAATPAEGQRVGMLALLLRRETLLLVAVAGSFGGIFGSLMSFGKNYTASLGLAYVSVLLWAHSVGAIASRAFIQQINRYFTQRQLVPVGLAGLAATFTLLALSRGYGLLGASGFLYGLSHGVLYPSLFVRFLDFQRSGEIGRAATLYQGSFSVGWGLVPLAGGTVVGLTSFPAFFGGLAALAAAGIALHRLAERAAERRAARE